METFVSKQHKPTFYIGGEELRISRSSTPLTPSPSVSPLQLIPTNSDCESNEVFIEKPSNLDVSFASNGADVQCTIEINLNDTVDTETEDEAQDTEKLIDEILVETTEDDEYEQLKRQQRKNLCYEIIEYVFYYLILRTILFW